MSLPENASYEAPYPLRRLFRFRFLPTFFIGVFVVSMLAGFGGKGIVRSLYLEMATRRAAIIDRALDKENPESWRAFLATDDPKEFFQSSRGIELHAYLEEEAAELALVHLKIYTPDGLLLFSSDATEIGKVEQSAAFLKAVNSGKPNLVKKSRLGTTLYELYVILSARAGRKAAIFELYEPADQLDRLFRMFGWPVVAIVGIMLLLFALALDRLVKHAQTDIDNRTALIHSLHEKLMRFVSSSAAGAVHAALGIENIPSKKKVCTLLYTDVRDFTGYSEANSPEAVVTLLNRIMDIQVRIVKEENGDVDKMIGDALLAHFHGADKTQHALRAAKRILGELFATPLPRRVGIGIYTGEVILGGIGSGERMDFTVIGDSVNVAARLCSAAALGEIVADAASVESEAEGFSAPAEITVKGRNDRLAVRRWRTCG